MVITSNCCLVWMSLFNEFLQPYLVQRNGAKITLPIDIMPGLCHHISVFSNTSYPLDNFSCQTFSRQTFNNNVLTECMFYSEMNLLTFHPLFYYLLLIKLSQSLHIHLTGIMTKLSLLKLERIYKISIIFDSHLYILFLDFGKLALLQIDYCIRYIV